MCSWNARESKTQNHPEPLSNGARFQRQLRRNKELQVRKLGRRSLNDKRHLLQPHQGKKKINLEWRPQKEKARGEERKERAKEKENCRMKKRNSWPASMKVRPSLPTLTASKVLTAMTTPSLPKQKQQPNRRRKVQLRRRARRLLRQQARLKKLLLRQLPSCSACLSSCLKKRKRGGHP